MVGGVCCLILCVIFGYELVSDRRVACGDELHCSFRAVHRLGLFEATAGAETDKISDHCAHFFDGLCKWALFQYALFF